MPESADPFAREAGKLGERLARIEGRTDAMEELASVKLAALQSTLTGAIERIGAELSNRLKLVEHAQNELSARADARDLRIEHLDAAMNEGFSGTHKRLDVANGRAAKAEARLDAAEPVVARLNMAEGARTRREEEAVKMAAVGTVLTRKQASALGAAILALLGLVANAPAVLDGIRGMVR